MRHKQVDGCSVFSALASAVSLNLHHTPCAPRCREHASSRTHKHTAPEKLVTRAIPITEMCIHAQILAHTLLTESERQRHLLLGVFDGSSMSHYAHSHHKHAHRDTHSRTNKQTN